MKDLIIRFTTLIFTISLFTVSGFSIKKDTKLVLNEIQKISVSLNGLEKKVDILSSEFSTLLKKIKILDKKVTAVTKSQADEGQNKESISLSLQFLKEEINTLKNSIGKVFDRLILIPTANPSAGNSDVNQNSSNETATSIETPDSIYYTAYSDYIKKNYNLAISGFNQFLKNYPDNAFADNSLYWIGECYYAQKEFKKAIESFATLIKKYNDGDKVPDSLLKMGYAMIETGNNEEGLKVLKQLVKRFPLSEEASLAQQKIRDIND